MQQSGQDYKQNRDFHLNGMHRKTFLATAIIDYDADPRNASAVDLRGYGLLGLIVPAIDNAAITFYVSDTQAGTYVQVQNATPAAVTIAASVGGIAIDSTVLDALKGYRWVKVHTEADQTADRTFLWILKG